MLQLNFSKDKKLLLLNIKIKTVKLGCEPKFLNLKPKVLSLFIDSRIPGELYFKSPKHVTKHLTTRKILTKIIIHYPENDKLQSQKPVCNKHSDSDDSCPPDHNVCKYYNHT